jgi:carbonic anhydrase
MTRMNPLLERNEQFARTYAPVPLGLPAAQVLVVTCLDHRVDPAIVLGLQLGDAPVIRNAGGRVTQAVIDDIAFLAEQLFGRQDPADTLFEVAVVHHTQCGTGFLADPDFRRQAAEATRVPRRRWTPPPSPTRTSPSRPTSSGCSHRRCSHRR